MSSIGGEYKYASWEIDIASADAAAGFTKSYIGAELEANLISAEGGFKIPIPFTDNKIYLGAEGNLFGVGFKTYIKNGRLTIGATALIGAGVTVGIE